MSAPALIQIITVIHYYEDHPSVRHLRYPPPPSPPHQKKQNKTKTNSTCYLLAISEQEVKKILKELSTEKSTGVDILPPKLVKLAANFLARPLSQSIDNSIKKGCFPKMQRLPQLVL